MSFVNITNGTNVFKVSRGAFEGIYKHQGYNIINDSNKNESEHSESPEAGAVNEDEKFCKDLEEKPISQWTKNEVKKYAELKGIDIAGTKNPNEAKEIIKGFIE